MVYAYDTLDSLNLERPTRDWSPGDRALARTMSSYWLNFARTGSPNGAALPEWPRYTSDSGTTLLIGQTPTRGPFPNAANLQSLKQRVTP